MFIRLLKFDETVPHAYLRVCDLIGCGSLLLNTANLTKHRPGNSFSAAINPTQTYYLFSQLIDNRVHDQSVI